jgi:hypothetical protein
MLILGPFGIVSVVLVVAGVWKVHRPEPARSALRVLGVRVPPIVVRGLGAGEVVLGAAAVIAGGTAVAAAVAAAYAAFAVVAWRLRDSDVGCGCFGAASSTPPGWLHVAVNVAAVVVGAIAALDGVPGHVGAWGDLPGLGLAHALLVGVGVAATLALLTVLPDARAAADGQIRTPQPVLFQPGRRGR